MRNGQMEFQLVHQISSKNKFVTKRLGIGDAILQKYVDALFGIKLCAPDLRAFALASDKKIKEELRAMEFGSVLANEKVQELRKVLELIRVIGMCSECV